ncbi:hypothetical protein WA158_004264 [Blastocystis sp. Blastoise]
MPADKYKVVKDEFSEFKQAGASTSEKMCSVSVAAITSLLPAFLFASNVYGCGLKTYPILAICVIIPAIILFFSYKKTEKKTLSSLSRARRNKNTRKNQESADEAAQAVKHQATSWAFFYNNAIYLSVFLLVARYVMPRIPYNLPNQYVCCISTGIAAAVTFLNYKGYI